MAQSRCDRCLAPTLHGVFKLWRGRLVRVGADCAEHIDAENRELRAKRQAGGMGPSPMQADPLRKPPGQLRGR
jgi:hypothetical protein